jgi:hypothetical protein
MPLQLYKIASVEVGSAGAANIDFSSIPQGYADLKLVLSARDTYASTGPANIEWRFNNSTSSRTGIYLGGRTTASSGSVGEYLIWTNSTIQSTANAFGNTEIYIPNYTSSNFKSISTDAVQEDNIADAGKAFTASLWSNTSAINRVTLIPQVGNFMQYTTAILYGIL